jgi:hypothetical protein
VLVAVQRAALQVSGQGQTAEARLRQWAGVDRSGLPENWLVMEHLAVARARVALACGRPQEALHAVATVAGQAADRGVDNGRGFRLVADGGEHFGLKTMGERAAELGADLEIDSAPRGGTRISV